MIINSLYPTIYELTNQGETIKSSGYTNTTRTATTETDSNSDLSKLGKNDFLKLLIAQLKNQDPLNPTDNTEFVAQLAQFSSLEQMTLMNSNLEKSLNNNTSMTEAINNAMILNYLGKDVTAETNSFVYDGGDSELNFVLETSAVGGSLEISDTDGNIVRNVSMNPMNQGANTYTWDGITDLGVKVGKGVYTYTLKLTDSAGNEVTVSPVYSGSVDGISYRDGVANLTIGGVLVPVDAVRLILPD